MAFQEEGLVPWKGTKEEETTTVGDASKWCQGQGNTTPSLAVQEVSWKMNKGTVELKGFPALEVQQI